MADVVNMLVSHGQRNTAASDKRASITATPFPLLFHLPSTLLLRLLLLLLALPLSPLLRRLVIVPFPLLALALAVLRVNFHFNLSRRSNRRRSGDVIGLGLLDPGI